MTQLLQYIDRVYVCSFKLYPPSTTIYLPYLNRQKTLFPGYSINISNHYHKIVMLIGVIHIDVGLNPT